MFGLPIRGADKIKLERAVFQKHWQSEGDKGVLLLLEPTPGFYQEEGTAAGQQSFSFLLSYLRPYRRLLTQLLLGLLLGSIFQLIFPFLTQALVDVGIETQNIAFIYLILIGQLTIFLGQIKRTFYSKLDIIAH